MNNEEIFKKVEIAVHQVQLAKEFKETIEYDVERFQHNIIKAEQMYGDLSYSGNNILEVAKNKILEIQSASEKILQGKILHLATVLKNDVIFNGQLKRMREYKNDFNCEYIEEHMVEERAIFNTNDIIEIKDKIQELGFDPNLLSDTLSIYLYVEGDLKDHLEKNILSCYSNNENTVEEYDELKEFINIIKNQKSEEEIFFEEENKQFSKITVSDFCNYQFGKSKEFNTIDYDKFFELKREKKDYEFFNLEESTFEKFNLFDDDGIALTHITDLAQHFDKDEVSKKVDEYDWICHQAIAHYCDECINQGELLEIVPTLAKDYNGTYSFNESNMDNSDLDNCIDTEFLNNETERRR